MNELSEAQNFLPLVSLFAGLGGSLHCVGMCGGLVTASCEKSPDVIRYQLGRLVGYLILGVLAGVFGSAIELKSVHPMLPLLPALFIGVLFIYWGYQNFRGRRAELPMPRFFGKFYQRLWSMLVKKNKGMSRAFFTGLISLFLPCGLLYGVALGTVALQHTTLAIVSMFFFWLGTLPSMVIAPTLIQKIIRPFKSRLPKTFAVALMMIGVLTITFRVERLYQGGHLHQTEHKKMSCH
jgi:sulfite exporter TauE/SafE